VYQYFFHDSGVGDYASDASVMAIGYATEQMTGDPLVGPRHFPHLKYVPLFSMLKQYCLGRPMS